MKNPGNHRIQRSEFPAAAATGKVHEQREGPSFPMEKEDAAILLKAYNDLNRLQSLEDKIAV